MKACRRWERSNADRQIDSLYRSAPSSISPSRCHARYDQNLEGHRGGQVGEVDEHSRLHLPIVTLVTSRGLRQFS